MSAFLCLKHAGPERIVACDDDSILGYLDYRTPDDDAGPRNAEIVYLWVDPAKRRQGVATMLLTYFINLCCHRKIVWISMWTGSEYEKAGGTGTLYLWVGFDLAATQEDYYGPGIPTRLYTMRVDHREL